MGERRGGCSSSRDIGEHEAGRKDPLEAPESGCPEDLIKLLKILQQEFNQL